MDYNGWQRAGDFPVHFLGFKSTMFELDHNGWEIAVARDDFYRNVRLSFRHQYVELVAISDETRFERDKFIVVNSLGRSLEVVGVRGPDMRSWEVVSKDVLMRPSEEFRYKLTDAPCFKSDDTLFDKADWEVIDHLEAIKNLQRPKQKELRQMNQINIEQKRNIVRLVGI